MELHENLARLRKEKGLSQLELAEELNVTRQAVSRWETGAAVPMVDTLVQLSKLYGVTVDDLLLHDVHLPEKTPEPVPEEPPKADPPAKKPVQRFPLWPLAVIGIAAVCVGILIWGVLTNSGGDAVGAVEGILTFSLIGLFAYTLIRVLRYISRREKEIDNNSKKE